MPRSKWFLRCAVAAGPLAMFAMEAGWTVSEVGRQPWIVYNKMRVEDAATTNTGVWITFIAVAILYIGLGLATILVLRGMSRHYRDATSDSRRPTPRTGRVSQWKRHRRQWTPPQPSFVRCHHHLRDLRRR